MWEEIVLLFTQMNWIVLLLVILGLVFLLIELFVPGFGICGILGCLCEAGAVICHAIFSASSFQAGLLLLLILIVAGIGFVFFVHSAKSGKLSHSPIIENGTAIPINYRDNENNALYSLIGKRGIVIVQCRPLGRAKIEDVIYDVNSLEGMLKVDTDIIVVDVSGKDIYVKIAREDLTVEAQTGPSENKSKKLKKKGRN